MEADPFLADMTQELKELRERDDSEKSEEEQQQRLHDIAEMTLKLTECFALDNKRLHNEGILLNQLTTEE